MAVFMIMLLFSHQVLAETVPKLAIGIQEAKKNNIPTKGTVTHYKEDGSADGDIIVLSVVCANSWAVAGYCAAGLIVAIMIADTLNGVNPIAPGSGIDTITSNLDAALGKPGAATKNLVDDVGKKIDKSLRKPVGKIRKGLGL